MPHEFDQYDRSYDQEVNKALSFSGLKVDFFTRVKGDYLIDIVDRFLPPTSAVEMLDLGCGTGNLHRLLAGCVRRLAGVDVSADCIAVARERNPGVEYEIYDGVGLPYSAASFDIVVAVCVFHHVLPAERAALVHEVRRVLRTPGLFVIFEHNPANVLTRRVVSQCVFDRDAILLHPGEAEELLRQGVFRDVQSRFILTIPPAGDWLRALDQRLSGLGLGAQFYTLGRA